MTAMLIRGEKDMALHGKFRPGLLLLLISFVVISDASGKALGMQAFSRADKIPFYGKFEEAEEKHIGTISKQYRYETAYACEGKTLKIECNDGEVIKLIRANYGRFSITICNDHGNTDWSVNCMSPKSLRVLHTRCTHYQNCSIPASTSMFGDPCPATHKYLEAHYQCLPATTTTTTSRPSPPWLITSQPPMWSTTKSSVARTSTVQGTITSSFPTSGPSSSSASVYVPSSTGEDPGTHQEKENIWWNYKDNDNTTISFTTVVAGKRPSSLDTTLHASSDPSMYPWPKDSDFLPFHCNSTTIRNIYWASTRANDTAIQPCPPGTTGFAKWHCSDINSSEQANWFPENPDLSECRSVWLTSLEQRILAGKDQLVTITSDLAQVTSRNLYGGDMAITTKIIQKMADKMSVDIQTFPDTRQREEVVTEMLMDVAKTSSNLLDASQDPSWKDLSFKDQMSVATSLLTGLEENAFLLADTVMTEKIVNKNFKNILLSVRVLDTKNLSDEKFPSNDFKRHWNVSDDLIEIPRDALLENSDGNFVRLVFVAFDRLEEILIWTSDVNDPSEENMTKVLNSKVISASLGKGRHIQLKELVKLTMKHIKSENVSNPKCVFWDYTMNAWSEEGCHVDTSESNYTHTVCYCDHLTNFAILMDVRDVYLPLSHEIALRVITYIGCIISVICLILAIVIFQWFRVLKSDRTTIHCNLCTCLLIAEFIFLVGINQTENRIFCGVIAGFLQYFFLCAFVWMFLEGFQLYVMLIEVFEVEKSRIRWYYILAYGLPFLLVFISATIYPQGYGTYRYCWLKTDNYLIYSFVGPVLLVILLNVIFLTMAIIMMCRSTSASVSLKNKEHSRLASTRAWLKGAFVLVFLLGLTWIFGFLYVNQESVVMAYLFAMFNSFQGFFIFLFHCVQNEKVRKEYRKFIRKHSWLPKCLHCSKTGSGTGSSSGGSGSCTTATGGTGKEGRPSLYAGSNGHPSQGANSHFTNDSVLTPHGTSLQRSWNSQSCTNVNRASYRIPVPTSTSANMAATLCRPLRDTNDLPRPSTNQEHSPNTSTLPYIRNFYKNSLVTPNIPKSVSTWASLHKPLHWKNISFKSYSRDSGHGGSEQEDSPRLHIVVADRHNSSLAKDVRHGYAQDYYGMKSTLQPHCVSIAGRKKNMKPLRWGHHTYQEIYDAQTPRSLLAAEEDPVYEEIDRNEIQISDMSDEDAKRQSDMSRQSSRSYGDHRPLIPYSPGTDRNIDVQQYSKELEEYYRMRCSKIGQPTYRMPNGEASLRSLAAVLDGETVVCHLESPEINPSRGTFVLSPYNES